MFTNTAANIAAQKQSGLFDDGPQEFQLTAPQARMGTDGWVGHPGPLGKGRAGSWTHPALPGVTIKHCGHPTALRPYYVEGIEQLRGLCIVNLSDAKLMAMAEHGKPACMPADGSNVRWIGRAIRTPGSVPYERDNAPLTEAQLKLMARRNGGAK